MASLVRTYKQKKLLGQVYTPAHIVEKILDEAGFVHTSASGKTILDPACGDGRFLVAVVERIIKYSPTDCLSENLHQVHGWDIDAVALAQCREALDKLVVPLGLTVDWKLYQLNAFEQLYRSQRFDIIVGNPPYIRIQHLPAAQRTYLQTHYTFCRSGSTDAYVAFFELASRLLSEQGTCGFITPNSYFTSETARSLRQYFQQEQNLSLITNFGSVRVFENAGTYAAITIFGRSSQPHFRYECSTSAFEYQSRVLPFEELKQHDLWQLSVVPREKIKGTRLGDLCRISVGLTTLSDSVYLLKVENPDGKLVTAVNKKGDRFTIEKKILKPIVKASRLKNSEEPIREYILFPYHSDGSGKQEIIPEADLRQYYPQAYQYLLDNRDTLDRRDNGKPNTVAWYAFGRSQSLETAFGPKIIFSPMNREPNFIWYPQPDSTVYSGYFIKFEGDGAALAQVLNSALMADYIATAGRDFRGGWKGYSKKIVENFIVPDRELARLHLP
ncbi:Eco57I restriction-modification methylase domain-containing protein [Telluribacter sp.]|jgi:methylase of polypeptide subunit release factors|uniref:Eco57I restriction-modification methylase domain-containing protein n=1 Tax=Telluribacter sp. TaxID=1978767 RepID=UPI002E10BB67|nr:N-6 DNA methylase [Telluribacter sp.]